MVTDDGSEEPSGLSPDEAFSVVGNETRLQIMETLGRADGPLAYSELFDRIDYEDSANFTYHLNKLRGHFIRNTDRGYSLRQAAVPIVTSILSGAVTDYPVVERTETEESCPLCGSQLEVSYHQGAVLLFCSDCGGTRGESSETTKSSQLPNDFLGGVNLAPAGVYSRDPTELFRVAEITTVSRGQAIARGVCPLCTAPLEDSVEVCEDHDAAADRCERCDQRFAATIHVACTNCIFDNRTIFTSRLLSNTDLMAFMIDHGIDPVAPGGFHLDIHDETVLSVDPFEARYTFTDDDEAITLTVNDDLEVLEATRYGASESV